MLNHRCHCVAVLDAGIEDMHKAFDFDFFCLGYYGAYMPASSPFAKEFLHLLSVVLW